MLPSCLGQEASLGEYGRLMTADHTALQTSQLQLGAAKQALALLPVVLSLNTSPGAATLGERLASVLPVRSRDAEFAITRNLIG